MKLDLSQITRYKICTVSRWVLLLVLILQLSVPAFALTLGADNDCKLSSSGSQTSLASMLCIEDVEDESVDSSSKFFSEYSFGESQYFSHNNDLPRNYVHPQLYSRSPPGT